MKVRITVPSPLVAVLAAGLIMWAAPGASATTYFVRADGGSEAQCTGLADTNYPGTGEAQACAWNHPFRAFPPGAAARISGGDTVVMAAGSYQMGYGAPGADSCDSAFPWDCHMAPVPSGPDPNSPTRLVGAGWDEGCSEPPELWGTERTNMVINLAGSSNIQIACLELTDHEGCVEFHAKPTLRCEREGDPYGEWAPVGISASDSSNVLLQDLNIHGFANTGIHAGRLADWTLERVRIAANGWAGWDGDIVGDDSNSGMLTFRHWTVEWNGCGETWPGENPSGCWSQTAGGYGDGVGTGETLGHWVIEDSAFLNNTSDGLDLLYVQPGGSVEIRRTRAEQNAGNQIKTSGPTVVENSIVVGHCAFFDGQPFTYDVDHCRALGNALSLQLRQSDSATVVNNTITGQGDCLVLAVCDSGTDGSESVVLRNNILQGQTEFLEPGDLSCLTYADECSADPFDVDYSVIADVKDDACPGLHDICGLDVGVTNKRINRFNALLVPDSPAIDSGLAVGGIVPGDDFEGTLRPLRGGVDRGAFEAVLVPSRAERACRKEIRRRSRKYFKQSLVALQRCVSRVNAGTAVGPCPDTEATEALVAAAAKVNPDRLASKCPDELLSEIGLGGACSGVESGGLASCIIEDAGAVVEALIAVEFAQPNVALEDEEKRACQEIIARQLGKPYALRRIKLFDKCLTKRDKGKLTSCLDSVSQERLDRVAEKMEPRIASKCTDEIVRALQDGGGFAGTCGKAETVAELAACQMTEHDDETDRLIAVVP